MNSKSILALAATTLISFAASAQQMPMPMQTPAAPMQMPGQPMQMPTALMPGQAMPAQQAAAPIPTKGEVTRINEATGQITLRHEPIANLDMGGMNMVFRAADPAMLQAVKVGDQVIFEAARVEGQITILKMTKAAP